MTTWITGRPMIAKQASAMSMSELTLSLLQRDQPEIWHYLDQMPHSTFRAGIWYRVAKKVLDQLLICNHGSTHILTESRWALQPQGTQWFPKIGLFLVQAISLGPCRWPIEFLTSSHPCGHLSKIQNSQIHKVEIWNFLSNFPRKDFSVISHEHKHRFLKWFAQ